MRFWITYGRRIPGDNGAWESIGSTRTYHRRQSAQAILVSLQKEGYDTEWNESADLCQACKGRGHAYQSYRVGLNASQSVKETCGACKGTGFKSEAPTHGGQIP